MQTVTTIGLDIAKSVFQVHGVDAAGQVVVRRQLKRRAVLAFFQKVVALLVARAPSTRPFGAVDAAGLREALRQASEE
jgi:transposase